MICLLMAVLANLVSAEVSHVVLMGSSSLRTSYLPENLAHKAALQHAMDAHYGEGRAQVHNWADNGEFIARFLITGKYERFRKDAPGVDVFIIRFGANDAKRMHPPEFAQQLEKLIALLKEDFPDAKFILEDGMYLDYPAHYRKDRNQEQLPYWEQTRAIAEKHGVPLSALFEASKRETEQGNWDLRIRSQRNKTIVCDSSQDDQYPGDIDWFTDIHPNPVGVQVAVAAEMEALKSLFPETLPTGGRKTERESKSENAYIALLNFAPERLKKTLMQNPDGFQTPVQ